MAEFRLSRSSALTLQPDLEITMSYTTLSLAREGHLARVTLNRPDVRNAFNDILIAELTSAFNALSEAEDIRVVVLAANGTAFCAGADLNWMKRMAGYSREENFDDARQLARMLHAIWACQKPVIAAVQGDTYAGGMGLVAACDIAVAANHANFCLSEARIGLVPATIGPYVIRAMGEQAARRYFVTAERFDALHALQLGFVHEVVAPDALEMKVAEIATTLAANSPAAVRESKRLVQNIAGRPVSLDLINETAEMIATVRSSTEGREGVRAFLEKRKPSWLAVA